MQGELKDRVRVLGTAVLSSLQELKNHADPPVFVVTSASLGMVPGVVKSNLKAEPAVASRLDNMEKMLETLSKGMQEMKDNQKTQSQIQWPDLQLNGVPLQQTDKAAEHAQGPGRHGGVQVDPRTGARNKLLPVGGLGLRSRSDSRKRKAEQELQAQREQQVVDAQDNTQHGDRQGWNDVAAGRGRGRREKVQYGTSNLRVSGGDAAPYDVFVGNTHPDSTEEVIKDVLKKVSESMPEELKLSEPLEILEVECLTKQRDDGRPLWTKNWRVRVENKFREHMLRPEAFPAGWTSRRYFPPRDPRPKVASLDPTQPGQQTWKRPNLGQTGLTGQPSNY